MRARFRCSTPPILTKPPPTQSRFPIADIVHGPLKFDPNGSSLGIQSQNTLPVLGRTEISPRSGRPHLRCCSSASPK